MVVVERRVEPAQRVDQRELIARRVVLDGANIHLAGEKALSLIIERNVNVSRRARGLCRELGHGDRARTALLVDSQGA